MSPGFFDASHIVPILPAVIGILVLLIIVLAVWITIVQRRISTLLGTGTSTNIEEGIRDIQRRLDNAEKFQRESTKYLRLIESRVKRSLQTSETLRFNPFKGTGDGGNQSFATTFINENGDGVVLSSLYSRERVSIFSKPIKDFKPTFELSEEEEETLKRARQMLTSKPQDL